MRFVATVLCWLVATVGLAVAIPSSWAQLKLIDQDGYAALASSAARDPALQNAMASLLTEQTLAIASQRGVNPSESVVRGVATSYTASSLFPGQFADVNRVAHRWLFTDAVQQSGDRWTIDVAPMLSNLSVIQTVGVPLPPSVRVPLTSGTVETLRPGELRPLATWGPWVSIGATVMAAVAALLTVAAARQRGKAVAALGVSVLLVGGGGWAAMEIARRYIDDALTRTTGNIRRVADVMVSHAEGSLHHWLNLTLAAGGAMVVVGVLITMIGAARNRPSAIETQTSAQT